MTNILGVFSPAKFKSFLPGFSVSLLIALAAKFLSEHYNAPALLLALLLGIAFNFLSEDNRTSVGIDFTAKTILRIGVVLLGARISFDLLLGLGPIVIGLVILGVIATILVGTAIGRLLGANWQFALLTSGAVAICGASAAMAIAAVLPDEKDSERNLLFTVLGVTVLSSLAMIFYPVVAQTLGLNQTAIGVFLGATIHDVAQVVGAGFSVSDMAGENATLVKLMRVAMLAPVVVVITLLVHSKRKQDAVKRPPLLPMFVIGFLVLAIVNSFGLIPSNLANFLAQISRWALLIAIAAVGVKMNLAQMRTVGVRPIVMLSLQTAFLALLILAGLYFTGGFGEAA